MKYFLVIFSATAIAFATSFALAEGEAKAPGAGPGKAVLEASKDRGIKLSEKAKATIGIKTIRLGTDFRIPRTALIHARAEFGVYVKMGDWFKYLEVEADDLNGPSVKIESKKVKAGDEIVVSDVSLLRLAELNVWNVGGDND